mgnify:CR=1 FL=1
MKRITITLLFALLSTLTFAQNKNNKTMEQRLAAIEDKMAIKYVVDEFSNKSCFLQQMAKLYLFQTVNQQLH